MWGQEDQHKDWEDQHKDPKSQEAFSLDSLLGTIQVQSTTFSAR